MRDESEDQSEDQSEGPEKRMRVRDETAHCCLVWQECYPTFFF